MELQMLLLLGRSKVIPQVGERGWGLEGRPLKEILALSSIALQDFVERKCRG